MPKKCKHEWDYSLYLNEVKKMNDCLVIRDKCVIVSTCKLCEKEISEVVIGGIVFNQLNNEIEE